MKQILNELETMSFIGLKNLPKTLECDVHGKVEYNIQGDCIKCGEEIENKKALIK